MDAKTMIAVRAANGNDWLFYGFGLTGLAIIAYYLWMKQKKTH